MLHREREKQNKYFCSISSDKLKGKKSFHPIFPSLLDFVWISLISLRSTATWYLLSPPTSYTFRVTSTFAKSLQFYTCFYFRIQHFLHFGTIFHRKNSPSHPQPQRFTNSLNRIIEIHLGRFTWAKTTCTYTQWILLCLAYEKNTQRIAVFFPIFFIKVFS